MGVLYEHWRPDLNECFYVGISWAAEDARPYDMAGRNQKHISVQEKLAEKGLAPEVRIQARGLDKNELLSLEPFQISYWNELIGSRLTNMTPGGEGVQLDWTEDRLALHTELMRKVHGTPEARAKTSERMRSFYQTERGRQTAEKIRLKKLGSKQPDGWSERSLSWKIGNKSRTGMSGPWPVGSSMPDWVKERMSTAAVKRCQTEEGRENVKNAAMKGAISRWGTTEELAQAILDFEGTHEEAAKKFGGTVSRAKNIRTRKTWRHLTPSKS